MPLPLAVSCFSKIHVVFTFPVPAHLGVVVVAYDDQDSMMQKKAYTCQLQSTEEISLISCYTLGFVSCWVKKIKEDSHLIEIYEE